MPEPEKTDEPFDFSLVCTDKELERHKRLALNLSGLGRQFANSVDEMAERKRRYEQRQRVKATVLG